MVAFEPPVAVIFPFKIVDVAEFPEAATEVTVGAAAYTDVERARNTTVKASDRSIFFTLKSEFMIVISFVTQ